jgi:hypothetical protein
MKSVDTFHKRLRDEIAAVEKEIQSQNQQVESSTKRLEGLKRADELFESDQVSPPSADPLSEHQSATPPLTVSTGALQQGGPSG